MKFILSSIFIAVLACGFIVPATPENKNTINDLVDQWHLDASKPNFERYFGVTTNDFVFLGTAPGERWSKKRIHEVL